MQQKQIKAISKKHKLKVDFVNYGTASRIGNTVLFNKDLLKYPAFAKKVIDHEIRHSSTLTKNDIVMDLTEGDGWDTFQFTLRHPRALTQLVPFGKYKGTWFIDTPMFINYGIILFLIGVIYLLLKQYG